VLPAYETERTQERVQEALRGRTIPQAKNRGRLDVVADVLNACSMPASKNSILIKANINSVTATYVLAQLIDTRLLDTVVDEEDRVSYIATKQGVAFVTAYKALTTMLSSAMVPDTKIARTEIGLFA
jgi:predicted transcriptional regulator